MGPCASEKSAMCGGNWRNSIHRLQADQGQLIVFSCHGFGPNQFLYWSADSGQTWGHSKVLNGFDECSIAMLSDGESLGMSCRTCKKRRAQLTWDISDATAKLRNRSEPPGLIDPGCQGSSLIRTARGNRANPGEVAKMSRRTILKMVDGSGTPRSQCFHSRAPARILSLCSGAHRQRAKRSARAYKWLD